MRRKVETYLRLGLRSVARVALYRLGLRSGLHPVLRISSGPASGPFFAAGPERDGEGLHKPERYRSTLPAFSAHEFPQTGVPDWNSSPFQPDVGIPTDRAWHEIGDFSSGAADIKMVWEASRFDWAISMAQRSQLGEHGELDRLNEWIADWQENCPPYYGANWMCGQEASIRVLHLAAALLILRQENSPLPGLLDLIEQHLDRIAPTMGYALGQDNNHGTSEAAALFIGGSLLIANRRDGASAWAERGRKALEERVASLVASDGSFSQYSVNYHRLMLDTLSLAEIWRRRLSLPAFSSRFVERARLATQWLRQMTDGGTGDAPNFGANDGALLIPLSDTPYRDFRPSVQLGAALFCNARAFAQPGSWNRPLEWLDIAVPDAELPSLTSETFDSGGMHVLRAGHAVAYLRYPLFSFRPGQADLLHCDFWVDGSNVLRDGGSYSYASDEHAYFTGTVSHNTAQFDGRDQMPRLSRFLFGGWLKSRNVERVTERDDSVIAAAGYVDEQGAGHHRRVTLRPNTLECRDFLSGSFCEAVIRWRLRPGNWVLTENGAESDGIAISVEAPKSVFELSLVMGKESREYLKMSELPVLEIRCSAVGELLTKVKYSCA